MLNVNVDCSIVVPSFRRAFSAFNIMNENRNKTEIL